MMDANRGGKFENRLEIVDGARETLRFDRFAARLQQRGGAARQSGIGETHADAVIAGAEDHFDILLEAAFDAVRMPALHRP